MSKNKVIKERINYIKSNGRFIGMAVNFPGICEAKSKKQLKKRMKVLLLLFIEMMSETLELEDSFELKKVTYAEFMGEQKQADESTRTEHQAGNTEAGASHSHV